MGDVTSSPAAEGPVLRPLPLPRGRRSEPSWKDVDPQGRGSRRARFDRLNEPERLRMVGEPAVPEFALPQVRRKVELRSKSFRCFRSPHPYLLSRRE